MATRAGDGVYPQGFGAASGYPQGVSWRLNAPASGGIVEL